jgi:hypothetical protein
LIARRSLLVLALVAGCIAGALYYIGAQRVPMIVAAQDVAAIRPLTSQDLEVRSVPPEASTKPSDASRSPRCGRANPSSPTRWPPMPRSSTPASSFGPANALSRSRWWP